MSWCESEGEVRKWTFGLICTSLTRAFSPIHTRLAATSALMHQSMPGLLVKLYQMKGSKESYYTFLSQYNSVINIYKCRHVISYIPFLCSATPVCDVHTSIDRRYDHNFWPSSCRTSKVSSPRHTHHIKGFKLATTTAPPSIPSTFHNSGTTANRSARRQARMRKQQYSFARNK